MRQLLLLAVFAMLVSLTAAPLEAATWTGTGANPTEFTAADNWNPAGFPTAAYADISNATNPTAILSTIAPPGSPSRLYVGNTAPGKLFITGQTLTVSSANFFIGYGANVNGAVYQTGGTLQYGSSGYGRMAYSAGSYGYYSLSGDDTVFRVTEGTTASWIVGNSGSAVLNQSGGSISLTSNFYLAQKAGAMGVLNQTGGTAAAGNICIGNGDSASATNAYGVANIAGTLTVTGVTPASQALTIGNVGQGSLTIQQSGVVEAPWIKKGTGKGQLNFHGGTLRATLDDAPSHTWIESGGPSVYVYEEGATVDTGSHSVTAAVPFLAPTDGVGVASVELSKVGAGYIGAPVVKIASDTGNGFGATAVANVDIVTGQLTGVTVVNPGVGYADGDTINVSFTGGGYSELAEGTVTLNASASVSGGLTKKGTGTLTLAANNTYAGVTTVEEGVLSVTGSVAGDVSILSGAKLQGTGVVGNDVAAAAGSKVAPGTSIGTLTINGDATLAGVLDVEYDSATDAIDMLSVSGQLDLSSGTIDFSDLAVTPVALDQPAYVFASYGTLVGSMPTLQDLPSGYTVDYAYGAGENEIALVAIPEPSTIVLLALAGLTLAAWKRQ